MLITRILNKLGRTYSDILNFTTTQSESIPRLAGLVQCNLKAKMLKNPYLFVQFFLTAPTAGFFVLSIQVGTAHRAGGVKTIPKRR